MPTKKLTDLTLVDVAGGEYLYVVQSGNSRRAAIGTQQGQIPYISSAGLVVGGNAYAAHGATISPTNGSGQWVRIAVLTLPANYAGVKATFLVDREGADAWLPCWVHVAVWRTSTAVPPIPYAYIGVEPAWAQPIPGGVPAVQDAALVETSPGVAEVWVKRPLDNVAGLAVHALGSQNGALIALNSGTTTRASAPPSPVTGGVNVLWSTASARLSAGRIVETSYNSNGRYVRFSDGTQICWHEVAAASFSAQAGAGTFANPYRRDYSWTYPAAFASTPQVQVTVESTTTGIIVGRLTSASATAASASVEYAASGAAFTARLLAVGRWY